VVELSFELQVGQLLGFGPAPWDGRRQNHQRSSNEGQSRRRPNGRTQDGIDRFISRRRIAEASPWTHEVKFKDLMFWPPGSLSSRAGRRHSTRCGWRSGRTVDHCSRTRRGPPGGCIPPLLAGGHHRGYQCCCRSSNPRSIPRRCRGRCKDPRGLARSCRREPCAGDTPLLELPPT
jgi:hypothetical protein